MLNVDEFESAFRSADKPPFVYAPPQPQRCLLVTDLEGEALTSYAAAAQELLQPFANRYPELEWFVTGQDAFSGAEGVLRLVEEQQPDLIVTYRNLNSDAWTYAYSLGVYLNAMTRGTDKPVLITPSPRAYPSMTWRSNLTDAVMVIDDTLTGDDDLVNWGAAMVRPSGKLHLTHVESADTFERFMTAISKVPEIDTDTARTALLAQLLKEPHDYIASAQVALAEAGVQLSIVEHVQSGDTSTDYRAIIAGDDIDLVVFPTLEKGRIALHGDAYSLAVELTQTPILMV